MFYIHKSKLRKISAELISLPTHFSLNGVIFFRSDLGYLIRSHSKSKQLSSRLRLEQKSESSTILLSQIKHTSSEH
jgi:hypothetical protein